MRLFSLFAAAVAAAVFATSALSQRVPGEPVNRPEAKTVVAPEFAAADVSAQRFTLPPLTDTERAPLAATQRKRVLIGLGRDARDESGAKLPSLTWKSMADGRRVARVAVTSPDALSMRVGVLLSTVPDGTELRVAGTDGTLAPIADAAILRRTSDGLFWTPLTDGATQTIEIVVPQGAIAPDVSVKQLSHGITSIAQKLKVGLNSKATGPGASGACNIDVACLNNPSQALRNAIASVARMTFVDGGQTSLCTGTLLNDSDSNTNVDYFASANHCFDNVLTNPPFRNKTPQEMQQVANTLTTLWFFEASTCGGSSAPSQVQVIGGAQLLYNESGYDALLMRLNNSAPNGAYRSGWDSTQLKAGEDGFALHHPSGDYKKISQGKATRGVNLQVETSPRPEAFTRVDWQFDSRGNVLGITEGGSSGSGYFVPDNTGYFWRGGLYGGKSACGELPANQYDYYSRFDAWYPAVAQYLGGTASVTNYTDIWYLPNESGWGINITHHPTPNNNIFAVFYHYTTDNLPRFYIVPGGRFVDSTTFAGDVYLTAGPAVSSPFSSSRITTTTVGQATIRFTSDSAAQLTLTINGVTFSRNIQRLPF